MGYHKTKFCLSCGEIPLLNARRCASCLISKAEDAAEEASSRHYADLIVERARRIVAGLCISRYHDIDNLPSVRVGRQKCEECLKPIVECASREQNHRGETCLQMVTYDDIDAPICAPCLSRGGEGFRQSIIDRRELHEEQYRIRQQDYLESLKSEPRKSEPRKPKSRAHGVIAKRIAERQERKRLLSHK